MYLMFIYQCQYIQVINWVTYIDENYLVNSSFQQLIAMRLYEESKTMSNVQ